MIELGLLWLLAALVNVWLTLLVLLLPLYILPMARAWKRRAQAKAEAWREKVRKIGAELVRALRLAPMAIGYALERPPRNALTKRCSATRTPNCGLARQGSC